MKKLLLVTVAAGALAAAAANTAWPASAGHCAALLKQVDRGNNAQRALTTFVDDDCVPPAPPAGTSTPTLDRSAVDYGAHLLGQSQTETIGLTNPTAGAVSVAAVLIAGADPSAFSIGSDACSGAVLAPGARCDIAVTFAPRAGQTYDAVLAVADDGAGNVQLAALSGDGPVAPVAFSVTPGPNATTWPHFLPPTMWADASTWPVISYTYTPNDSPVTVSATDGNGLQLDLESASVHLASDCPMSVEGGPDHTFGSAADASHTFSVSLGDVPSFSANCTLRAQDPSGVIADGTAVANVAGELCDDTDNNGNGAGDELYPQAPVSSISPSGTRNDNPHPAQTVTIPGLGPAGTPRTTAWTCTVDGLAVVPITW